MFDVIIQCNWMNWFYISRVFDVLVRYETCEVPVLDAFANTNGQSWIDWLETRSWYRMDLMDKTCMFALHSQPLALSKNTRTQKNAHLTWHSSCMPYLQLCQFTHDAVELFLHKHHLSTMLAVLIILANNFTG